MIQCTPCQVTQFFISLPLSIASTVSFGTDGPKSSNSNVSLRSQSVFLALTQILLFPEDTISMFLGAGFCSYMLHLSLACCPFHHCQTISSLSCLTNVISWPADNFLSLLKILSLGIQFSTQRKVLWSSQIISMALEMILPTADNPMSIGLLLHSTAVTFLSLYPDPAPCHYLNLV